MKKIPFYNPASPLFFHIAVLGLWILISLPFFVFYKVFSVNPLFFSALYPFFAIVMAFIVRKAYINTYQTPVPEEFVNKLVLYNRYLIYVIYILSSILVFIELARVPSNVDIGPVPVQLIFLFIAWICFPFHFYILPTIIRFILLKKARTELDIFTSVIFLLSLLFFYIPLLILNIYCAFEVLLLFFH